MMTKGSYFKAIQGSPRLFKAIRVDKNKNNKVIVLPAALRYCKSVSAYHNNDASQAAARRDGLGIFQDMRVDHI